MKENTKNIIQTLFFVFLLILVFILNIIKKDENISNFERRNLAKLPEISFKNINSSKFGTEFENYAMDQFIFRDDFRRIKNNVEFNLFKKMDNNKLFIYENNIFKIEYPLRENSIKNAAEKFNLIKEKYIKNSKIYYSIIPDKSYYLPKNLRIFKFRP